MYLPRNVLQKVHGKKKKSNKQLCKALKQVEYKPVSSVFWSGEYRERDKERNTAGFCWF